MCLQCWVRLQLFKEVKAVELSEVTWRNWLEKGLGPAQEQPCLERCIPEDPGKEMGSVGPRGKAVPGAGAAGLGWIHLGSKWRKDGWTRPHGVTGDCSLLGVVGMELAVGGAGRAAEVELEKQTVAQREHGSKGHFYL